MNRRNFSNVDGMSLRGVKICFVGLYNEKNLGDPIIGDCVEWLYARALTPEAIHAKRLTVDCLNYNPTIVTRITNSLRRLARKPLYHLFHSIISREYTKYYLKEIKGSQLIVVVGGGLIKYTTQYFGFGLQGLLKAAAKENINVVFNAVGVEGYDKNNSRCKKLKKILHLPALKKITTRDDIDTLIYNYMGGSPNIPCNLVCDPAVWASEVYGITRKLKSNVMGIGVCREDMLQAHGYGISSSAFFDFYVTLVKTLAKEDHQVELFTNGLPEDNKTAIKIKQTLGEAGLEIDCRIPTSSKELVEIVSNYKCVVAARLHACIIAYSLEIPVIGLVWNDKLLFFGKNIGCEHYFIKPHDLSVDFVRAQLEDALNHPYDQTVRERYRASIEEDICSSVKNLLIEV